MQLRQLAAVGILVLASAGGLVFASAFNQPQSIPPSAILWRPQSGCYGDATIEAITVYEQADVSCASYWFILIPPSEHGNLSKQAAYLQSDAYRFSGIFLDDFGLNPASWEQILSAIPSWYRGQVCAVIWALEVKPQGVSCVAVAFSQTDITLASDFDYGVSLTANNAPVFMWEEAMTTALANSTAKTTMLLCYASSWSGWATPVPPNYLAACSAVGKAAKTTVVWLGGGP